MEEPRTLKEFERWKQTVLVEDFNPDHANPITFGYERTLFEEQRLKKIIAVAEKIPSLSLKTKVQQWRRQLTRLERSRERFRQLRDDFENNQSRRQAMPSLA